jgi:hypothetical protein
MNQLHNDFDRKATRIVTCFPESRECVFEDGGKEVPVYSATEGWVGGTPYRFTQLISA